MQKKKKKTLTGTLGSLAFVVVCLWLLWQVIACQVTISNKRQQLSTVETQLSEQLSVNAELSRQLDNDDDTIIERAARDDLGYAKPNERIFIDTSGN